MRIGEIKSILRDGETLWTQIFYRMLRRLSPKNLFSLILRICPLVCFLAPAGIYAEQLPVRNYTVADGLAHDRIQHILRDSQGFLWINTYDGISRYDGARFVNYGVKEGLPLAFSNSMTEGRNGIYWIASNGGGVIRFDPMNRVRENNVSAPVFTAYPVGDTPTSNRIDTLYEDRAGNIWAGTDGGLFRLDSGDKSGKFNRIDLNTALVPDSRIDILNIIEDAEGSLWLGTGFGLFRRLPDGRMFHYPITPQASTNYVWDLQQDKDGRIWVGYEKGLIVIKPIPAGELPAGREAPLWRNLQKRNPPASVPPNTSGHTESAVMPLPESNGNAVWYTKADGLISENVRAVHIRNDGSVWIGTRGAGLFIFDGRSFTNYSANEGINNNISALEEDINGNMWAGTQTGGLLKIAHSGFRSFGKAAGLGGDEVVSMFENQAGELYVITNKWTINRFDGNNFQSLHPNLPPAVINSGNGRWQIIEDHLGDWWVTTPTGLYRFPAVSRFEDLSTVSPILYTTKDGLADNNISRIFEDSRGDIWLSSYNPPIMLTRWERATNTFRRFTDADGLSTVNWANYFAEDALGQVWIGMHNGGLVRYSSGNFKSFKTTETNSPGITQGLYVDKSNRLWMATSDDGTGVIDVAASLGDNLQIEPIPYFKALNSENLFCFIEDELGNIYIGTTQGVSRVGLKNGQVRNYSTDDGLPNSEVTAALRDRHGTFWFGTPKGVARLLTETEAPTAPANIFINHLKIANVDYPVSELGQTELPYIELGSNQNQLQFDFFGLNFAAGGNLKYQYKLEGTDNDWSVPTEQRTFTINLTPGSYRFLVRAVMNDGNSVSAPASVSFRVLPPVWMRWWFITLSALALAAIIYAFYRYRLRRLLELERIRTRIATDLHDDIGSSLSQISILSEVVRQKIGDKGVNDPLNIIADISREMVDSMSDIVWAINPNKDHLSDLIKRIRRFAGDVLEAKKIKYHLYIPQVTHDSPLGTDIRREIYMIFKEGINNVVKHSEASEAELEVKIEHNWFTLSIKDNGKGFEVEEKMTSLDSLGGNGLINMKRRAVNLGGEFLIDSKPGAGTKTTFKIPLNKPKRPFTKKES